MKKNIFFATFVALVTLFASCGESKLQKIVKDTNLECPISMGTFGEVTSIELEDGNVVFNYSVNEDIVNIDFINENPDMMKHNTAMMLNNHTGGKNALFDALVEENAGLLIRYKGMSSGKIASISLSKKDIAELCNSTEETVPEEVLEAQVEMTNAQCPMQVDLGMVITHLSIEGDCVVYNVECDENYYSIETIRSNKELAKQGIKNSIDTNDPTMSMFIKICKDAEKGIAYKYIGNTSGDACIIKISISEL